MTHASLMPRTTTRRHPADDAQTGAGALPELPAADEPVHPLARSATAMVAAAAGLFTAVLTARLVALLLERGVADAWTAVLAAAGITAMTLLVILLGWETFDFLQKSRPEPEREAPTDRRLEARARMVAALRTRLAEAERALEEETRLSAETEHSEGAASAAETERSAAAAGA